MILLGLNTCDYYTTIYSKQEKPADLNQSVSFNTNDYLDMLTQKYYFC